LTLFDRIVVASSDSSPAIVSLDGNLTYGDLIERAVGLSKQMPPAPGSVLIYGQEEPPMVVAILVALRSRIA